MVCSCTVPAENYPENAEWGPLFWKLLHGLAELSGIQININSQKDEIRNWVLILESLQYTLPCDICRQHYSEWVRKIEPKKLANIPYSNVRTWIRTNLWELHNTINEGNNRLIFPFENLHTVYSSIDITSTWKALQPVIKKAIMLNGIHYLAWAKFLNHVRTLQGYY